MKKLIYFFLVSASLLTNQISADIEKATLDTTEVKEKLKDLDQLIEKALIDLKVPGAAIGIVVGDEIILSKGYGTIDLEKTTAVTEKT